MKYMLFLIILLSGCKRGHVTAENSAGTAVKKSMATDTGAMKRASQDYMEITRNLKGAVVTDTRRNIKTFYFSNPQTQDTFLLTVPPGLISKSRSELKIISAEDNTIYSDTFDTRYLVRGIFIPDTTPKDGGQEAYEKYMSDYINAITKERFESYIDRPIQKFFDGIFVTKDKFKSMEGMGEVIDKETLIEVDSTDGKVIWFPCFNCDEGVYYIGYSNKKQRAVKILSAD